MIDSYLWDGESVEHEFQLDDCSLHFTNKRFLVYSSDDDSKNISELPYDNISSVDYSETKDDSIKNFGYVVLVIGAILAWINIAPTGVSIGAIVLGLIFILIEPTTEFQLVFYLKDREPFILTGDDSILEDIFKVSRDYRGKTEIS